MHLCSTWYKIMKLWLLNCKKIKYLCLKAFYGSKEKVEWCDTCCRMMNLTFINNQHFPAIMKRNALHPVRELVAKLFRSHIIRSSRVSNWLFDFIMDQNFDWSIVITSVVLPHLSAGTAWAWPWLWRGRWRS